MRLTLTLLTALFIFLFAADTAAQSGRNKQAVSPGNKLQSSDAPQKTLSLSERGELDREMQKGVELYLAGQHEEAGKIFIKIIEADERHQRAWFFLGMVYARLYRGGEAERAFAISEKLSLVKTNTVIDGTYKPAEFIHVPRVAYTGEARKNFASGTIKVAVELGADGNVLFVYPMMRLPFGLTEMAIKSAQGIKFIPAQKDGEPITTLRTLVYTFGVE